MAETTISWAHYTMNPWIGCSHAIYTDADGKKRAHPGCTNCYAESDQDHFRGRVKWGPKGTRSRTSDTYWKQPLRWNREAQTALSLWRQGGGEGRVDMAKPERPRVFCGSLMDWAEDWQGPIVDANGNVLWRDHSGRYSELFEKVRGSTKATMSDLRRDLFQLIDATQNLDWLLLTKRVQDARRMWPCKYGSEQCDKDDCEYRRRPNVYVGYSASDQPSLEAGIEHLLACRDLCAGVFLSLEPLLGSVDLSKKLGLAVSAQNQAAGVHHLERFFRPDLDWVIVGGESGPKRRDVDLECILSIAEQCRAAGTPCHVKQDVALKPGQQGRIPLDVWNIKEFPMAK